VVRFEGNNAPKGVEALTNSDVDIIAATSLTDAAQLAVKAAGGAV
jgi:succinyl-CoA synthetase beta subunit